MDLFKPKTKKEIIEDLYKVLNKEMYKDWEHKYDRETYVFLCAAKIGSIDLIKNVIKRVNLIKYGLKGVKYAKKNKYLNIAKYIEKQYKKFKTHNYIQINKIDGVEMEWMYNFTSEELRKHTFIA